MTTPEEGFHGWAVGESAIYVARMPDGDNVGLYRQEGRVTDMLGMFIDEAGAQVFMGWVDAALAATGHANTQLLRRLNDELIVVPTPMTQVAGDDEADGQYDEG